MDEAAVTGRRIHLDLVDAARAGGGGSPPTGRYTDVGDPGIHARLAVGADPGCAPAHDAVDPAPTCCLTGAVIVDVLGSGRPRHLFVVLFPVPDVEQPEFDDWFGGEHAPLLTAAPGWARARLVALDDGPMTRMAVHDIDDLRVLDGADRQRAGETAWTTRIFGRNWATSVRRHVLAAG
ncbi:MAG: hypothetical protein JWQ26_63 [Modestobacter sp.]|nr:hypothetical protein [Modestobacter sp.]